MNQAKGNQHVPKYISLKVCDQLYSLIARTADKEHVDLIDVAVRAVATALGRPELGWVPRKKRGGRRPGAGRRIKRSA